MPSQPSPLPNSYWVAPDRLLAGEHPSGRTGESTPERIRQLVNAGIDCFMHLTEPRELDVYEGLLPGPDSRNAIIYLRRPISDHGLAEGKAALARLNELWRAVIARGDEIQAMADALFEAGQRK